MSLDFSPLAKAVASLQRALDRALAAPDDKELRDACIFRFACTYELSWKMLKRQLEAELPNPTEVDGYGYRQLFRVGAERGVVSEVEAWFDYRECRNITSHAYDAEKADRVFAALPAFARHAADLLARLQEAAERS